MARELHQPDFGCSRAMLDLLESIDREGAQTQRNMAVQFGVALGLVNTYLKICVKKGYVKVRRLPSRRYIYLLTPRGMTEKLRLAAMLLSNELERFRRTRSDYADVFEKALDRGWRRVVLIGASELAEISAICALEAGIEIVALVDPAAQRERLVGHPILSRLSDVRESFDGVIITSMHEAPSAFAATVAALGRDRVLAPAFFVFPPLREATA